MSLGILFNPVQKVSHLRVDAGKIGIPAADAPGDDAALHPRRSRHPRVLLLADERAARVALARVPAPLARAQTNVRDDLSVSDVSLLDKRQGQDQVSMGMCDFHPRRSLRSRLGLT